MLQTILLVAMILISVALAGVILLQRSEGGARGMGGGPSGVMTARGAGNLLTVTTWWLAPAGEAGEAPAPTDPAAAPAEPTGPSLDDFLGSTTAQPAPAQPVPAQ